MGYLRFTVRARFNRLRLSEKHAQDVFFLCVCVSRVWVKM